MLSLLDPRVWLACAGLAVGGYAAGWLQHWSGEAERWQARVAQAEQTRAHDLIRTYERQQEAMHHAHIQAETARTDARAAVDAAGRLRQRLAAHQERAAAACPGAPTGDPIGVLADVLRRADDRAGILAAYADATRLAGQACERAYDTLRTSP
jgi:hypothetical protein